jgi:hypothetical protein
LIGTISVEAWFVAEIQTIAPSTDNVTDDTLRAIELRPQAGVSAGDNSR